MSKRKISTDPIKQLLVELPLSEYQQFDSYYLERQKTKRQIIRSFICRLSLCHKSQKSS